MNGKPDLHPVDALFDRLVSPSGVRVEDPVILASLLALNPEKDRAAFLSRLVAGAAIEVRRLLEANGVPAGPEPPPARESDPRQYDEPACCEEARNWVTWMEPSGRVVFGRPAGPDRAGWCISGEFDNARIRYCPFCGRNLAAVKPRAR